MAVDIDMELKIKYKNTMYKHECKREEVLT